MLASFYALLRQEVRTLLAINPNTRPWLMPIMAGLASGLPLFIEQYFGHLDYGLAASLGGLVFLYLQQTPLVHRMLILLCASSLMTACMFLGQVAHHVPWLMIPTLFVVCCLTTMMSRFFRLPPPGSVFFVMSLSIAFYLPSEVVDIPLWVGLQFLGSLLACALALIYSAYGFWRGWQVKMPSLEPERDMKLVVADSLIIAAFVSLSLLVAQLLQLYKPYWVPISCIAVMQGTTFRAVWSRQLHRIVGTIVGLLSTWLLLQLNWHGWWLCGLLTLLNIAIESLVVRHYALATVFITPLTIMLTEMVSGGSLSSHTIVYARLIDTIVGALIGVAGAGCLHYLGLRNGLEKLLLKFSAYGKE